MTAVYSRARQPFRVASGLSLKQHEAMCVFAALVTFEIVDFQPAARGYPPPDLVVHLLENYLDYRWCAPGEWENTSFYPRWIPGYKRLKAPQLVALTGRRGSAFLMRCTWSQPGEGVFLNLVRGRVVEMVL